MGKKLLSYLIIFSVLFSLVACSNSNLSNNNSTTTPDTSQTSEIVDGSTPENTTSEIQPPPQTGDDNSHTSEPVTSEPPDTSNPVTSTEPDTSQTPDQPTVNPPTSDGKTDDKKDDENSKNNGDDKKNENNDSGKQPTDDKKGDDGKDESGSNINDRVVVEVEDIPVSKDEGEDIEIETPEIKEEVTPPARHTTILPSEYYQFSSLSSSEKAVYNSLVEAINSTTNVVNVQNKNITYNKALSLLQKVLADNPQFFWVSKSTSILYNPQTNIVTSYILYYTDGKTTDAVDSKFNLTSTADRTVINNKIVSFNEKIEEIVKTIPVNANEATKERMIHDYIVEALVYDTEAAKKTFSYGDTLPHAFDIYGAVCENKAVCEGYAKMFQYLCYCVGINATQIFGTSSGSNHMWNAVKIDGEWYQIDVTWNDTNSTYVSYYGYYNLTTAEMSKDHKQDTTNLNVPNCTGTKYNVHNYIALNVTDLTKDADNYKNIVDDIIAYNAKYLIVSTKNVSVTQTYLRSYIIDANSAIRKYANEKGYKLTFELKYRTIGDFIFIPVSISGQSMV